MNGKTNNIETKKRKKKEHMVIKRKGNGAW